MKSLMNFNAIFLAVLSISNLVFTNYTVREIDCNNQQEVAAAVDLYVSTQSYTKSENDPEIQKKTEQKLLSDKQYFARKIQKTKDSITFVCISNDKVCGVLNCRYGWRRYNIAECLKFIVDTKYKKEKILSVMLKHAEQVFKELSMKSLVSCPFSKAEIDLYKTNGYLAMDEDMLLRDYNLKSEGFFAGLFFPVYILVLCVCNTEVVYKNL